MTGDLGFDVIAHHRHRTRRAEARADALERHRDQLERLLLRALEVAVAKTTVAPLMLLAVLQDVDALTQAWELDLYLDVA